MPNRLAPDALAATPALRLPALAVPCPACQAEAGAPCTSHSGTRIRTHNVHQARTRAARQ